MKLLHAADTGGEELESRSRQSLGADGVSKLVHDRLRQLDAQKRHQGYISDERGFLQFDPSEGDLDYYWRQFLEESGGNTREHLRVMFETFDKFVVELTESLGRLPTPAEVLREEQRQRIITDAEKDHMGIDSSRMSSYRKVEVEPQNAVIAARARDFPVLEDPLEAFAHGPARIETIEREDGKKVRRLVITTKDADGNDFDHPVMTDEEMQWVEDSAQMIAQHAQGGGKVFIAGLGMGLLNKRLQSLGIEDQVVAELNNDVIDLVGSPLQQENRKLEIRQGDFKQKLVEAHEKGEQFDAISIDAFPNSADEVNRDASSREVLELAWKVLKPGGILTFYPDSRYIPARILNTLYDLGVPRSSIHYTVSQFDTSGFTQEYHYGDLMSVPVIQKPKLSRKEARKLLETSKESLLSEETWRENLAA